jgi:mannonate dehydratase
MKLGLKFGLETLTQDNLRFAQQMGVTHIVVHGPRLGNQGYHDFFELLRLKKFIESFDLEFVAIENLPGDHWNGIALANDQRDAQIRNVCTTIEHMGKVGIPVLGYYFSLSGVAGHWRAYESGGGRGGAGLKSFDYDLVKDAPQVAGAPVSVEEMWQRLAYFLERVVPVAENAGVKLAAHQDDPPAEMLFGTGRLLTNHDAMQRLIDLVPSPCNGLEFCQGTVAEMGPDIAIDAIRRFAGQNKIFYVHFRNVRGKFPKFDEVFIDEGDVNMIAALKAYKDAGYDGVITPDHTPRVIGDEPYGHRGRAFALGYIRAGMQALDLLT